MIGPIGPISLFSDGLGQGSVMRRLVIICIMLVLLMQADAAEANRSF